MKNLFFAAVAFLMVGAFASCTKTQTTVAEPNTAMVTLKLEVNNDMTNDTTYNGSTQTQYETVPAGTTVQFVVDTRNLQLNPVSGKNYEVKTYTATVAAGGLVTMELPAIGDPVNYTVKFADIELMEKTEFYNTLTSRTETQEESVIYTLSDKTITVFEGAELKREYTYN